MKLTLKCVEDSEIAELHQILVSCGLDMHQKFSLQHWHPFMDLDNFKMTLRNKKMYGVYESGKAIATFNVSNEPRDYYANSLWHNPGSKALYLGTLAVLPELQGNGLGKWCITQIEEIALAMRCEAIRFDAVELHPWLAGFYERLGYTRRGVVRPLNWNLECFEKLLEEIG